MNWKLLSGGLLSRTEKALVRLNSGFVAENYPFGRNWIFDLKRIIGKVGVIIDAGANVGAVSRELHEQFPDAAIYAFEPVKDTFDRMKSNLINIPHVTVVHSGLGAKNEKKEILLSSEHTINSLKITERNDHIIGAEQVDIIRIDTFLETKQLSGADVLKIDVEGFEFEVLDGCGSLLDNGITAIFLEVGYHREPTKVHFYDIEYYMESKGYELCGVYETRRNPQDKRRLWYANQLYIKRTFLLN